MDDSHLDKKYFLDGYTYNCPFCKRGSVSYSVVNHFSFNWNQKRTVYAYKVQCDSCNMNSLHLSNWSFDTQFSNPFHRRPYNYDEDKYGQYDEEQLDNLFFYHQPSSYFTIDSRIPEKIRTLVSEAEGCREMNFLVGSSGALRKAIYEFLLQQKAKGENYEDKIKWLKEKYPSISETYFDTLSGIQGMTSENLHENNNEWDPWDNSDLKFLILVVKNILNEVYVLPKVRKSELEMVNQLKNKSNFNYETSKKRSNN